MRFAFIRAEKACFPISAMCRVLEVSRSGFHAWCRRQAPARHVADLQLTEDIRRIHAQHRGRYGSPRIHAELQALGRRVGCKRVAKLMRREGIRARFKKQFRKTTDSRHSGPIAPNLVERRFAPAAPNQLWATDVTAIWTAEGWLFLAVMLDLFSRRVVGWATNSSNDATLALEALNEAILVRRPAPGLVHHSDRGSPYASDAYRGRLDACGILRSMSRKGDCWDNAVAESFFGTLRRELVHHESYPTHRAAIAAISDYIDNFYNCERRHSFAKYLSPVEYELRASQIETLVA